MKRVLSIRKGVLALLLALSLGMGTAYAYNFSAICSTGQTLYYNITDATNHYVEITCPGSSSWSGYTQPTGNIELPSYVTHNGVTYTVTAIGYKAFFNCSGLTGSLTIPNTVTSIGHLAFQGCSGFHGSLTFGTGVTSIGMSAFYGCTHFSGSLTIPDSVTEIQNSTFWSCSGFTGSLIIPNSVTSIGATAFQDCTGFTGSLTLGTGVTSIDNGAFYRCTGFTSIKAFPETPPTLGTTVFYNVPTTIPVFVPCGLLQAYQNAPGWSSFSNLVESCPQQLTVNNGPEDNNYIPVFGWFCDHYSKSQFIIPASDLQTMQQSIITKLTFYALNTNVSWGDARFDVYLAEVEETSFGSTTLDWTGMTKVLENASLSVANNKMEVVLSLPYLYQGGNLKVGIKQVVSGNNVTSKWYGVSKNSTVAIGGYEETRGLGFYQFLPKTTFDYFSAPQTSIEFADPQVKNICVANWDTNHDGELSYDEAAAVTELGTVFGETSITSFDELQYFTGLSYILDEAFFSCEQLTSVIIPSGVGTIYNNAFTGCSSLTSIIIPSSVHNIHDNPFMSCPALANIVVEAGNTVYDSRDNCNAIIVTATNTLKTGCINTVIPNNIEAIGIGAFWGCTGLTSIAIPNSVTIIGGGAFRFCSSLELFVFPNSVTYIGNVVFEDCTSLTSLTVPAATPPSLETNTFYGISTGIPVYVPCGSLAAYQAAAGWSNFTNIQCDLGNIVFVDPAVKAICVDNWDANGDGELSYAEAAAVTSLIPEGETNSAFYQNTSITSFNELQYFTGLEVINNEAFYNCRNLTQVTFPNSVISIMRRAFSGCHNLTSVTIPNSVIFIGQTAFGSCNLTSIVIPSSVTAIDDNPFSACSSLAQISVDEGNQAYSSPNNCNAIIETGTNTLVAGCKNTVIPEGVTTIACAAFNYCNDLTGINIPSSVTRIGESAFRHCTGLSTLTIPSAVNYIGVNAFLYCTGLTEITVLAPTPPELDGYVFSTDMLNIPVYVPCESLAAYQTYDNGQPWGGFTNIQCMVHDDFPYVDDFTTASGWQLINGDLTNQWVWGEAGNRGDPHIYISDNNGISNHYTNTSLAMVYAAKMFRFEEGWYRFQYDWLAYGESNYDYLRVALVPASVTLSAGTAVPTGFSYSSLPSGWIALDGGQQLNMNAWWQTTFSEINVPAGDYMMVFAWHNDDSDGYQPPAAIDNVSIRPVSCLAPVGLTAQHVGRTQVTLDWTPVGNENEWEVWLSWPNGNETWSMPYTATTHPFTISGLGAGVTYTATVNAKCGPDNTSYASNEISFTTSTDPCDNPATFPFSENFDGYAGSTSASVNILPDCWSRINTTTVSSQQGCPTILQASYAQSAPNFLYFLSSYVIGSYEDPQDQYAILPPMDHIDHMELSLYARSNTTFMVGVMTDPTDAGTFTELATCQPSPYTYTQYSIPLDNYTGDGWYIAIKMPAASSDMNERALFIDDVSVDHIITFADANVKAICVQHWDTNGDGELSYGEAAAVTSLIPEGETNSAFYQNTSITSFNELQYFTGLEVINNEAFYNCRNLTQVTFPNSVISIMRRAFSGCHNLTSVTIPNSVIFIGQTAFGSCNLTSIVIPSSVTAIDDNPFSACSSLAQISVDEGNQAYSSPNNCNAIIETGTNTLVAGCKNTVIPEGVTTIACAAFNYCNDLTGINIPSSVTRIGESAFRHCTGLSTLTIPSAVNYIGVNAFLYCTGLTEITVLAPTPPELDGYVFSTDMLNIPVYVPCESLAAYQTYNNGQPWGGFTNIQCIVCSAELPLSENFDSYPGVTSGSENVLPDCWSRINTTTVSSQQGYPTIFQGSYAQSAPNFLYFMSTYAVGYFEDPQDQYAILPSIDNVSDLVLSLYARIPAEGRNATFMVGVMTDPEDASTFTELATLQPTSTTYTHYSIPLGNYTGNGWYIAIKMPAASSDAQYRGVCIDDVALDHVITFADPAVKALCVASSTGWDTNGDGELSYTEAAAVTSLYGVFSSEAITSFNELQYFTGLEYLDDDAFYGCYQLSSVIIPSSVTDIGGSAFSDCSSLTSVTIPSSVTSIGSNAFSGSGLTEMTVEATTPPTLGNNAFQNVPTNLPVYVPCNTKAAYQAASGWSAFTNIIDFCDAIVFADANVKAICVDNWDTNGDGELSYDEAAAVMTLKPSGAENSVFWNTEITSFDELQYFTGLTSIEENAFMFCNSLTSVTLPNAVTSIGSYAFAYCISLTSVSLPNSLTTIGDFAFTNATSLSTIELPLSLMDIGMMAFDNCGLVSVVIPASVMGIGINPFTYCSSLTSITVDGPSNVFYTPNDNALVNSQTQTLVTGLSTTIIPNTVTTIGAFAFDGCINLTSITIPNSVTYIDNLAFHYCIGLTSITVEATTPPTLGNDVFQAIPVDIPVYVPCESLDAYQDYNNTGSPWGGFTNIKTLNEHFPWTEDFENYAGLNNNNTNYNTMPSCWSSIHGANPAQNYYDRYPSVYTYSSYAHSGSNFIFFADNYNTDYTHSDQYAILPPVENVNQMTLSLYALKEYRTAYFEVGVMTDPDDASTFTMVGSATATTTHTLYSFSFANYTGTGTYIAIRMPKATNGNNRGVCIDDVTLDHVITFADPAVKAICVQNWDTNGDGELSYIEAAAVTSLGQVFQNAFQEEGTNVTFNELQYFTGLTSIGANAFAGCWRLTSVTLPPTVTTIGSNAFTMCSGLASSPITNHVTEIGDYAFNYCYSLTEIELPSSVTSIGNRAFDRCYYLTSVVIPASVTSIGINPFSGCTRLASIVVDEGNTVYGSPNGCNAIINTEEHLLVSGCNNTNIPDGVQTIGWYAFLASGLTTLTIPASVNSIADYAFSECEALSELTLLATTPPTLEGTDVFSYINLDIPVYVPCESLEAYQTYNNGQPWGGFTNIRCDVCSAELPLSENFDSYQGTTSGATNVLPDCWDRINTAVDIAYTGYPTILNEPANAYSGSNYLRFHYNQGYGSEQYVILPYVDDIAEVSLWFYAKALTEDAAIFVGVMTDPNDVSTFETAFEIDNLTSDYQQCNVSIDPEYINDQTHYIAIKSGANNGATQCDLCIDNLELLRITQQNLTLAEGWNWWTPTVRTYRSALQYALGSNGIIINSQDQGFQKNNGNYWSGTLPGVLEPGQMYKIKTNAAVSATLQGLEVAQPTITIVAGYNWFGYAGAQAADIATAIDILGVSPTDGDTITDKNGNTATYNGSSWSGNLTTLQPGHGYVYRRQ